MTLQPEIAKIKAKLLPENWEDEIDEDFGITRESVLDSYTSNNNLYRLGLAWKLSLDARQFESVLSELKNRLPVELIEYINSNIGEDRFLSLPIPKQWMPTASEYKELEKLAKENMLYPDEIICAIASVTLAELPDAVEARSKIGDASGVNKGYDHW